MLIVFRRHLKACKYSKPGVKNRRERWDCNCPIAVEGKLQGRMIRQALDVRSREAALKICRDWEVDGKRELLTVSEAMTRFTADHERRSLSEETIKKFKRLAKQLPDVRVDSISPDDVAKLVETWELKPSTQMKQLERLRSFFRFCEERGWIKKNPAKGLKPPKEKSIDVKPYTPGELEKIYWAIPLFPKKGIYKDGNAARILAFVNCLRWTGLRIRDVVQLRAEHIEGGYITLRTQKNGKPVKLPMHKDLDFPVGAYPFWSGDGNPKSCVGDWQRTLRRLSSLAGVTITAHRFRHTFAADLLSQGVSTAQVAVILGNTPRIVEKHYSQFIEQRQKAIDEAVSAIWK